MTDFYDDFDDDNPFDMISMECKPELVKNVSMLRHFMNVWGITVELKERFNLDEDKLAYIYDNFPGKTPMKGINRNFEKISAQVIETIQVKEKVRERHDTLISQLSDARTRFCGLGTRKVKLLLNKLAKTNILAKAYREALEAEDKNISAKNTYGEYVDRTYKEKEKHILELSKICKENGYVYGKQKSDVKDANSIVYFELPGCEQISFHTNLNTDDFPEYLSAWDGKECSTFPKLEHGIIELLTVNSMLSD